MLFDAHSPGKKLGKKKDPLLLTGGDIKHNFLLQFYAIESRNVPIFRHQISHTEGRSAKQHLNLHTAEKDEIGRDHGWSEGKQRLVNNFKVHASLFFPRRFFVNH